MDTEIQLGSPKYSCDRFGICKIDAFHGDNYTLKERKALAKVSITKHKMLTIKFYKESILPKTLALHFMSGFFTVSADSSPSGSFFETTHSNNIILKAGLYPIKSILCFWEVNIPFLESANSEYLHRSEESLITHCLSP